MNDEMKKILSRFLFVSVIISCVTLIFAGTLTAKQRSEYNSYYTKYAVLTLKTSGSKIDLSVDEKNISFDLGEVKKLKKYSRYIYVTPFASAFFLFECVFDLFSG